MRSKSLINNNIRIIKSYQIIKSDGLYNAIIVYRPDNNSVLTGLCAFVSEFTVTRSFLNICLKQMSLKIPIPKTSITNICSITHTYDF